MDSVQLLHSSGLSSQNLHAHTGDINMNVTHT